MRGIDDWLGRQARRERRLVTLEEVVLGGNPARYARYRLRFFGVRALTSAVLHVLRLTLLRFVFAHQTFFTVLLLNAVAGLASSFWWGGLEVMRERVRRLARDGDRRHIPGEIRHWLAIAAVLAAVPLAASLGWVGWQLTARHRHFNVLQLYVFSVAFRLAVQLVVETLHSGVYALRRVYRPLVSIVAVELASFVGVLGLWPWLGRWAFPIATLASAVASGAVVVRYTLRAYHLLGWLPLRALPDGAPARPRRLAQLLAAGASYALMKMDAVLMVALFHLRPGESAQTKLFLFFVAVGPAVQAGFDWAQLLYFDLKRLGPAVLCGFRRRYEELAARLGWLVGALLWAAACLLATAILRRNLGLLYLLVAPFFLSRSVLARAQVVAFARRRYAALLGGGVALLAAMWGLRTGLPDERVGLPVLAAVAFATAWLLDRTDRASDADGVAGRAVPLTEWLAHVRAVPAPVRIRAVRFARPRGLASPHGWAEENRWRLRQVARRIGRRLKTRGAAAVVHPDRVVWYETGPSPLGVRRLVGWGGGLLASVDDTPVGRDGEAALRAAAERGFFGLASASRREPEEPEAAFARIVRRGLVHAVGAAGPGPLGALPVRDKRKIFAEAVHFAGHLHARERRGRWDVTSFAAHGELALIFVVDRRVDRRARLRWRRLVARMNVEAATGAPLPQSVEPRGLHAPSRPRAGVHP